MSSIAVFPTTVGFMPFIPALALACLGLVGGSLLTADRSGTVAVSADEA